MSRLTKYGLVAGVGAAVAYLFDPDNGRSRRAVLRDRSNAFVRTKRREVEQKARYASDKAQGLRHEIAGPAAKTAPDDATVADKIRSEVLRHYDASRVNVNVEDGIAVLRGELKHPEDIKALSRDVARVPGVRDVRSLLHLPN